MVAFYLPSVSNSFVLRHLDWITGHRFVSILEIYNDAIRSADANGLSVESYHVFTVDCPIKS